MDIYTPIPTINPLLRQAIYQAFDGKCFYTGQKVDFLDMHIDHVLPKSKGGQNCIANYVLTSSYINEKKNGKLDELLVERMLYINKLVFAPKTLMILLEISTSRIPDDETPLKPYIKEKYPNLLKHFPLINLRIKSRLKFRQVDLNGNGRNTLLFKIDALEKLLPQIIRDL
jgi:hypothetical protein